MKHGWEYKKFTDVCDVQYGFAFDSKFFTDDENAMPLIRIRDVMRGYSETFYNGEIPNGYLINEGDYLVGMDGEFNIGRWGKRPGLLNQRVCKMSSSSKLLDNQYMYYFMKVCLKSIEDETPFVTVKHLSAKRINLIEIPLPPLLTQQSIASELDKINELIRLKKEQLKDYDNLAQSIFYEMFGDPVVNEKGWEVKKLREVCECITDGDHMPPPKSDKGVPFVTIGNINKDTRQIEFDKTFFVPKDYFDNIPYTKKPKQGDILYTVTGSYGIPLLITFDKEFCFQRHIGLLRPNGLVNSIYLYMWASNKSVKGQADVVATGIAQRTVSLNSLRGFNIILPPLPLQQLFAKRIELIEQQKAEIQSTIADLETLLASRMQYWFD